MLDEWCMNKLICKNLQNIDIEVEISSSIKKIH